MNRNLLVASTLFSRAALDGSLQSLVQGSPGALIFTLRNSALPMFYLELKQLTLELVEERIGAA